MLMITDTAAAKITELLEADNKGVTFGLRVSVSTGGCSGLQYMMDFDTAREGDEVFTNEGTNVYVDARSLPYLQGAILDYKSALQGAGFVVSNPNASSSGGSGSSFAV